MKIIIESSVDVKMLPPGFSNQQFNDNLAYFKANHQPLYQKIAEHQCQHYKVCLNPDNSQNILNLQSNTTLYPSTQEACDQYFDKVIDEIQFTTRQHTGFLGKSESSKVMIKSYPLYHQFHKTLFEIGNLSSFYNEETHSLDINYQDINFLPLLRIYGIGLGNHILKAIQKYDIACLIIHESSFDLFYSSLYVTPWNVILTYFANDPHKHCQLNIEDEEAAIQGESALLQTLHPFFHTFKASIYGLNNHAYQKLTRNGFERDFHTYYHKTSGWYEDQAIGFKHSLLNINQHSAFYNGKKGKTPFKVFLIGSGPSLNESINFLKDHASDAIIIACGSSISILDNHQIIPDIHIWQERPHDVDFLLNYADLESYKSIISIKLNVVMPGVDNLYSDTFVIQKYNDPGSTILPIDQFPSTNNVNPTVTNTGIALCSLIGASDVFLFGIDYGSTEKETKMHANGSNVFGDDTTDIHSSHIIEGNFSEKIYAPETLYWSYLVAKIAISEPEASHINWVNVGDGAKINNTSILKPEELKNIVFTVLDKESIKDELKSLFSSDYSIQDANQYLKNVHIPASREFLLAMIDCFETIPASRCALMTTFALITEAASVGSNEDSYLPKKLFGVEFVSFLSILYVQICNSKSDKEAISLYKNAIPVLIEHIDIIFQDFLSITEIMDH